MSRLEDQFSDILSHTKKILEHTGHAEEEGHSQAILFRKVLAEQQETVERLIPELQKEEQDLSAIKTDLSIVYHDNEMVNSTYRAWVRGLRWTDHPKLAQAEELGGSIKEIKSNLEKAAAELEEQFGFDKIKYVIPSFYLPAVR